jgi:hypothetical protein
MTQPPAWQLGTQRNFATQDLVKFRITEETVRHGIALQHGQIVGRHGTEDGPRYNVLIPLTNERWQRVNPCHLMKDVIA